MQEFLHSHPARAWHLLASPSRTPALPLSHTRALSPSPSLPVSCLPSRALPSSIARSRVWLGRLLSRLSRVSYALGARARVGCRGASVRASMYVCMLTCRCTPPQANQETRAPHPSTSL